MMYSAGKIIPSKILPCSFGSLGKPTHHSHLPESLCACWSSIRIREQASSPPNAPNPVLPFRNRLAPALTGKKASAPAAAPGMRDLGSSEVAYVGALSEPLAPFLFNGIGFRPDYAVRKNTDQTRDLPSSLLEVGMDVSRRGKEDPLDLLCQPLLHRQHLTDKTLILCMLCLLLTLFHIGK